MKYKLLTDETKVHNEVPLYRIQSVSNFNDVKAGDKGGWIEKESNLSQHDDAWVYGDAKVYGDAMVYGNSEVYENAKIYGNVEVSGNTEIY